MKYIIFFVFAIAVCHATEFSSRARNFSIELLHFTQKETDGHVVISPFGVWSLMTGVTLGANGETRRQLIDSLHLPSADLEIVKGYRNLTRSVLDPNTEAVSLTMKSYIFHDRNFKISEGFRTTIKKDFEANVQALDFKNPSSAAKMANLIIEKTAVTVSNVMKSDDFTDARMIVTNVISFRGLWQSPFNESETAIEPFYNENKKEIGQVKMMHQRSPLPYSNVQEIEANVLELPYGNDNKYSMLVILPYPRRTVRNVYSRFTDITLDFILERIDNDTVEFDIEEVDVKLPRFQISTNVVMNKPLNAMGVFDIFSPAKANFKRISSEDIFISSIVHKANIEVTESGTVATADTSAYFSDRISTPTFEANRPFIYAIIERPTRTIIFNGIYSKPTVF